MPAHRPTISATVPEDVAKFCNGLLHGEQSKIITALLREYMERQSKTNREALLRQKDELLEKIEDLHEEIQRVEDNISALDARTLLAAQVEKEIGKKAEEEAKKRADEIDAKTRTQMDERAAQLFEQHKEAPGMADLLAQVRANPKLVDDKTFVLSGVDRIKQEKGPRIGTFQLRQILTHAVKGAP